MADTGSDEKVIALSLVDPSAFAKIFDRHFVTIYGYLARRVGPVAAEDLASQTFVVAFERRNAFQPHEGGALPWLYRIATNLLRNHRRSEQHLVDKVTRIGEELLRNTADVQVLARYEIQRTAAVLETLDPGQRDVLLLFAWADLSYNEIAVALDVPVGTVRSRLSRARRAVRIGLREEQPTNSPLNR